MAERKPQTYRRLPQVIDINLLPEEYRRRPLSDLSRLLIILMVAAAAFLYPLNLWWGEVQGDILRLKKELRTQQQEAKKHGAFETQLKELKAATDGVQRRIDGLNRDRRALEARSVKLSRVLLEMDRQAIAKGITFTSITQQGSRFTVKGDAPSYAAVLDFGGALRGTGLFSRIFFQQTESRVSGGAVAVSFTLIFDIKVGAGG